MVQASAGFGELARAGQDRADMRHLRTIGLRAEAAMLAVTGGINTHRGANIGLGLLCAAAGEVAEISADGAAVAPARLGDVVMRRWAAEIGRGPIRSSATALRRSGAMERAARGPRPPVDFAASTRWAGRQRAWPRLNLYDPPAADC